MSIKKQYAPIGYNFDDKYYFTKLSKNVKIETHSTPQFQ